MKHLVYRNRRRLCFTVLSFGMLAFNAIIERLDVYDLLFAFSETYYRAHITGILFSVTTLVFLVVQILLIRFKPNWRGTFDTLPAGVVLIIALNILEDRGRLPELMMDHPVITVMLIMYASAFALNRIRFFHRLTYTGTATYTSSLSPQALWDHLWPDPSTLEGHYEHLTKQITTDPENPAIKYITYNYGVCEQSYRLVFSKQVSPQVFDYLMYPDDKDQATTRFGMAFKPEPFGTSITVRIQSFHLSPIAWLVLWCDDHVGQMIDHQDSRDAVVEDYSTVGLMYAEIAKNQALSQTKIAA